MDRKVGYKSEGVGVGIGGYWQDFLGRYAKEKD